MKKTSLYFVLIFFATFMYSTAQESGTEPVAETQAEVTSEFDLLIQYLEENGNFINSEKTPALISPDEIKKNFKNEKYLVLDIRSESWFEYGHIKNAKNVKAADLLTYFENDIDPASLDKIVLICYSGQSASYFAGLLRLAGYDNVYSMKWGMSSWRQDFAENSWLKNIKNDFAENLETTDHAKPEKGTFPVLKTGKTDAKEILRVRLDSLFAEPYKEFIVKSADVFETPSNYFVAHYGPQDVYAAGHIPGAINYTPKSLTLETLATLPVDKKIALYDSTGLGTAYALAYLNVLGYDAGNIAYGMNAFMNETLKDNKWDAFTNKDVNMFPVIE
ncbi:MAG: rhodanese-like domain-containing protein [Flavobacteriaceae bacterium]|nr:rhodanese-like domain-containing protein [Flavobacteriaceae bacterium]